MVMALTEEIIVSLIVGVIIALVGIPMGLFRKRLGTRREYCSFKQEFRVKMLSLFYIVHEICDSHQENPGTHIIDKWIEKIAEERSGFDSTIKKYSGALEPRKSSKEKTEEILLFFNRTLYNLRNAKGASPENDGDFVHTSICRVCAERERILDSISEIDDKTSEYIRNSSLLK
jgi:hypothetical protein